MDPVYDSYNSANFGNMFSYVSNPNLRYKSWAYSSGVVTYTFNYAATLDNQTVAFYFSPASLGVNETKTVPIMTVNALILASNNLVIVYY